MPAPLVKFKRGDTFILECTRLDQAGEPVSVVGKTITSQVRVDAFVEDLSVTTTDPAAGKFRLSAEPAATALWPVSLIDCDVQFVGDGLTESTDTFVINNVADVTREA